MLDKTIVKITIKYYINFYQNHKKKPLNLYKKKQILKVNYMRKVLL